MSEHRAAKAALTQAVLVAQAREMFVNQPYADVSLRKIASAAGFSTGSIYKSFRSKGDLWREAMGCEPPGDTPLTRRASELERTLRQLVHLRLSPTTSSSEWEAAWRAAEIAIDVPVIAKAAQQNKP